MLLTMMMMAVVMMVDGFWPPRAVTHSSLSLLYILSFAINVVVVDKVKLDLCPGPTTSQIIVSRII